MAHRGTVAHGTVARGTVARGTMARGTMARGTLATLAPSYRVTLLREQQGTRIIRRSLTDSAGSFTGPLFTLSGHGGSINGIDQSRPAVFVLLGSYLPLLSEIEARYPDGEERIVRHDGLVDFEAYEVRSE